MHNTKVGYKIYRLHLKLLEQTLAQSFQPYLPSPVGLWPLSKALGTTEVTANKIPGNESWIAYDTLYTPGKLSFQK